MRSNHYLRTAFAKTGFLVQGKPKSTAQTHGLLSAINTCSSNHVAKSLKTLDNAKGKNPLIIAKCH